MISIDEWERRILLFFVDRSGFNNVYQAARKEEVFESFASHKDANMYIAFLQLENKGLILRCASNGGDFYMADIFDKSDEIKQIIETKNLDTRTEIMQPDESETLGLKFQFTSKGYRTNPTQSTYYYYTKEDDDHYWICLHKTKPIGKASKIILGSFQDPKSKITQIWNATKWFTNKNNNEPFLRKRIEDIEPKACGNNRLPSKAAFDIFVFKKWILETKIGRKTFYQINIITKKQDAVSDSNKVEVQKS